MHFELIQIKRGRERQGKGEEMNKIYVWHQIFKKILSDIKNFQKNATYTTV